MQNNNLKLKILIIFAGIFLGVFCLVKISQAAVSLPWSTTYNCDECLQPSTCNCDDVTNGPSWGYYCNSDTTYKAGITSAANNPNGGGGKGARFWVGDGQNANSGTLQIDFNKPGGEPELYIRWYFKYPLGFAWSGYGYDKWLYIHTDQGNDTIVNLPVWSAYSSRIYVGGDYTKRWTAQVDNYGWYNLMGGLTSDGNWHWAEVHIKMDTNTVDGIAEMWVDGTKTITATDMNFNTKTGWTWFHFKSNQSSPNNGGCVPVYYDDMAISATGPIGPITPSDTTPPAAPTGVTIS